MLQHLSLPYAGTILSSGYVAVAMAQYYIGKYCPLMEDKWKINIFLVLLLKGEIQFESIYSAVT